MGAFRYTFVGGWSLPSGQLRPEKVGILGPKLPVAMNLPATLDVVIPTFNRKDLLRKTLASLASAAVPAGMAVQVIVVNNNSSDGTADVVEELAGASPLPIRHVLELRQSLSSARNAGIAASGADLIGFVDDDEEVEPDWFEVIAREFADPAVEFIGGPYLPNWVSPVPDWLPPGYHAAIGAIPPKPRGWYNAGSGGNLMGGNAVMRRSVFERVGLYALHLGRSGKGLLSEEDADMFRRILAAGIQGMYVPDLAIRHYIAPDRLTRAYHRRWVYWRGASQGVLHRTSTDPAIATVFGVQRYRFGEALRGLLKVPGLRLRGQKGSAFAHELAAWDLAGFVYGRHFLNVEAMYKP